jgi:hypothetical protein
VLDNRCHKLGILWKVLSAGSEQNAEESCSILIREDSTPCRAFSANLTKLDSETKEEDEEEEAEERVGGRNRPL